MRENNSHERESQEGTEGNTATLDSSSINLLHKLLSDGNHWIY